MSACTFASAAINFGPLLSCSPDATLEDGKALSSRPLALQICPGTCFQYSRPRLSPQLFQESRALREWLAPRLASRRYPQVRWGDAPRVDDNSRHPISSKQRSSQRMVGHVGALPPPFSYSGSSVVCCWVNFLQPLQLLHEWTARGEGPGLG